MSEKEVIFFHGSILFNKANKKIHFQGRKQFQIDFVARLKKGSALNVRSDKNM